MSLFSEDSEASNSSLDSGYPVTRDLTNPGVSVVFGSQTVAPNSPTPECLHSSLFVCDTCRVT